MVSFWLENPNNLLNKNYITEIWPNSDFNLARKLNAITRLIIILTILGYFFTKSPYIPVSALVSIVILVIIYKTKIKTEKLEEFVGSFKKREHPHAVKDLDAMMQKEFTMPTKKNPVMNVLMTEYSENPNRKPAAPSYNEVVEEEINDKAERKDNKLFKNLGDNLSFEHSMRNFYAMPNTKIPNNQKDFAMFCYGNMPSCKEGDEFMCEKNSGSIQ